MTGNFNPLPPHGGRPVHQGYRQREYEFQSTPSAWRETNQLCDRVRNAVISIHSLRMEGDDLPCHRSLHPTHFNPLPPHGGRPISNNVPISSAVISIHSLRMEGDNSSRIGSPTSALFQSTPSAWRETSKLLPPEVAQSISIHSLRMEGDRYAGTACFLVL